MTCCRYLGLAQPGNKAELRADAPSFKPSPAVARTKSEAATKTPVADAAASEAVKGAEKRPAEPAERRSKEDKPVDSAASQPSDAGPGPAKKPSTGNVKPPIHPEAVPRSGAGKRVRDAELGPDAAKAASQPEAGKAAGDEQEPKRRKVQSAGILFTKHWLEACTFVLFSL